MMIVGKGFDEICDRFVSGINDISIGKDQVMQRFCIFFVKEVKWIIVCGCIK